MSEQSHPETLHQPGSAPSAELRIVHHGSTEPFFDPKNTTHTDLFSSEVKHILLDRKNTRLFDERVIKLATLSITAFNSITGTTDAQQQADPEELKHLHNTALSLRKDTNQEYLLELIDETVEPVEDTTPIVIAKYIKRVHTLHKEPEASLLLTKMWVLERMDVDMPTDYLNHFDAGPPEQKKNPSTYTIVNTL